MAFGFVFGVQLSLLQKQSLIKNKNNKKNRQDQEEYSFCFLLFFFSKTSWLEKISETVKQSRGSNG